MPELIAPLSPLLPWFPAFALIFGMNLGVAIHRAPLGKFRWILAGIVAAAPGLFPERALVDSAWGALSTIITTLAITTAARLADLDRVLRTGERGKFELYLWMSSPVARFMPSTLEARRINRGRAGGYLVRGLLKRGSWELIAYAMGQFPGEGSPWILKSSVLILFFVLNVTAAADVLSALTLASGADIDEVFDAPLLSQSPRDFWSRRWNKFIHRFALKHVAIPLGRRIPPPGVIAAVFAVSGAFHEYFAWGVGGSEARHGLMMLFFSIQAVVVWLGSLRKTAWLPRPLDTLATFAWMVAGAPLFFAAVMPALWSFGYPPTWTPSLALP